MSTLFTWNFSEGSLGWQGDFADYPPGEEEFYELDSGLRPLPENLGDDNALFITGANRSDDLFMYFRREIDGLTPNTDYQVTFDMELASNAPDGSFGIGGSPANSVYLKAGATLVEPLPIIENDENLLLLNVDKGNQASAGSDSVLLGDIAKPDDGTSNFDYALIERSSQQPYSFRTDDSGSAWLYFGTDSGFEGTTTLYYTNFAAEFVAVNDNGSTSVPEASNLCFIIGLGILFLVTAGTAVKRRCEGRRSLAPVVDAGSDLCGDRCSLVKINSFNRNSQSVT